MNKKSIIKIGLIMLIIALIFIQVGKVEATDSFASMMDREITDENGNKDGINYDATKAAEEEAAAKKKAEEEAAAKKKAEEEAAANKKAEEEAAAKKKAEEEAAKKKSLPQTGANENIIISLIVVLVGVGIYTFKKVREYNI